VNLFKYKLTIKQKVASAFKTKISKLCRKCRNDDVNYTETTLHHDETHNTPMKQLLSN